MLSIKIVEFDYAWQLGVKLRTGTWQRWWRVRSWRVTHAWLHIPRSLRAWAVLDPEPSPTRRRNRIKPKKGTQSATDRQSDASGCPTGR